KQHRSHTRYNTRVCLPRPNASTLTHHSHQPTTGPPRTARGTAATGRRPVLWVLAAELRGRQNAAARVTRDARATRSPSPRRRSAAARGHAPTDSTRAAAGQGGGRVTRPLGRRPAGEGLGGAERSDTDADLLFLSGWQQLPPTPPEGGERRQPPPEEM